MRLDVGGGEGEGETGTPVVMVVTERRFQEDGALWAVSEVVRGLD